MRNMTWRRFALGALAPVGALLVSALICSVILIVTGHNPFKAFATMGGAFGDVSVVIGALNTTGSYYLAAVAVAIGFKMNLLNIGVDGQYRMAAMISAALAGAAWMTNLPGFLRVAITLICAMLVGASWAGIAVWLKVTRGVSEVISTIMLNAIATSIIAYLLTAKRLGVLNGNSIGTKVITGSGMVRTLAVGNSIVPLYTLNIIAIVVGVLYALLLSRTVFGFSIKATGLNPSAAVASGISAKKTAVITMLISGAVAGLVGMPELLNNATQYSINFPSGLGLTGIAIALLGRNSPVGMVFAALLWAALDGSANALQGIDVPSQIVVIMQGTIVLSVVIAYELVRRYRLVLEQKAVAGALADTPATSQAVAA